ncbi:MAG: hypothetical protein ACRDC2_08145 [Plesiomonas shigelloides]
MAKLKSPTKASVTSANSLMTADMEENKEDIKESEIGLELIPDSAFRILIQAGQAEKISPNASGVITWQLAMLEDDNQLYLRLISNGSGGLFSKDWVSLNEIKRVLENQSKDGFTSSVFKALFKGASTNNAGFLAAVLRCPDICLIEQHHEKLFTHVLYPDWIDRLEKLSQISIQD